MRKIVLFFLTFCVLFASCDKMQKQPLNYTVTNDALANGFYDIYIPDTGNYNLAALVKFLNGYPNDSVMLVVSGLPKGIKVTPDTFSAVPTFTGNFVFYTNHMAVGVYPVSINAYTPTQLGAKTMNFNIHVVPADAASLFWGALYDSCACNDRTYSPNPVVGVSTGSKNALFINNFAGFGPAVNVLVYLNEQNDSLVVPQQVYGNGSTISGVGTFTSNQMVIYYTAFSTPTNTSETCTAVLTKQ